MGIFNKSDFDKYANHTRESMKIEINDEFTELENMAIKNDYVSDKIMQLHNMVNDLIKSLECKITEKDHEQN